MSDTVAMVILLVGIPVFGFWLGRGVYQWKGSSSVPVPGDRWVDLPWDFGPYL